MKPSLHLALVLVAVAACNSGGRPVDTYPQYLESSAAARCARAISCKLLPESDRASCEQFFREATSGPLAQSLDAIEDRRVAYDRAAARRCIEAIDEVACIGTTSFLTAPIPACSQVLVPRVASGGSCQGPGECQAGDRCTGPSRCEATCVAAPTENQTCEGAVCALDLYCDYDRAPADLPTCARQVGRGERCLGRNPSECRDGLVCIIDLTTDTGTCQPPAARGEPCFGPGNFFYAARSSCQPGLACNWLLPSPVCQPPVGNGEECGALDACQDGLVCFGYGGFVRNAPGEPPSLEVYPGRCGLPPTSGAPCTSPADCPWQHGCIGAQCERLPRLSEACSGDCAAGYCEPATSTCQPRKSPGAACDPAGPPTQCSGFPVECDPTTARCVSTVPLCEDTP